MEKDAPCRVSLRLPVESLLRGAIEGPLYVPTMVEGGYAHLMYVAERQNGERFHATAFCDAVRWVRGHMMQDHLQEAQGLQ